MVISNNSNKNSNEDICSNTELSNELSQSQDSSSSDPSQSVLLGDAEMIEASGVRKRGISSVDVSSDGAPTRVPASRNGAKKRVSDRASSQEPRRAVHANLPSFPFRLFLYVSVQKSLLLLNGSDHYFHQC